MFSFLFIQIMRKILGTHLGHSALCQMITLLKDHKYAGNANLLRGAIFNTSMGMWGGQKVSTLNTTACTVLPAFMEVGCRRT
jgi:tuberous sclerosis 2